MELRWTDDGRECVGRFRAEAEARLCDDLLHTRNRVRDLKPIDDAGVTMSGRSLTFMLRVLPGSERYFLVPLRCAPLRQRHAVSNTAPASRRSVELFPILCDHRINHLTTDQALPAGEAE